MRERIEEIIEAATERHRKYKHFEELTGIASSKWANLCKGNQRANDEMIEALGRAFPQYAYWLVTGLTDEAHGHTSPVLERIQRDLEKVGRAG